MQHVYEQAKQTQPHLIDFLSKTSNHIQHSEVVEPPTLVDGVKGLKTESRSLEKLHGGANYDVTRLTDISRATIMVNTPTDAIKTGITPKK
jgi:hypothetical protein